MTVLRRAPLGRGTWLGLLAASSILLEACSGSSASTVTGPVGTSVGVSLNSSTGSTLVQQGATVIISATVSADPTNAGVTWNLAGVGTLSNITKTEVTYTAPTGVTGSVSPILTATAIADITKTATALLVVLGTPVIDPTELFPANVGSLYTAQVSVSGGLAPFTWAQTGGTLPPGIALGASTTAFTTVSGTPTTIGAYSFQLTVTDANKKTASVDLSMTVKATAACLLEGQYAALYTGYVSGQVAVGGTAMNVSSTGTISGYHDFNPGGTPISETLSGLCATRTANNGTTQIIGVANTQVYNYAMTTALLNGRVQLINGGSTQSGSGPLEKQTPADFVLAKLAGNFAFGALGGQPGGTRTGTVGAITVDGSGHVTSGHADSNGDSPLTDATLTGTLTAPDATTGRGTLTLTATGAGGVRTMHFAYYIVTADRLFITSTDASLQIAGMMTRQVGPFSNTTLSNPGILSLWGATSAYQPKTALALGRLSGADPGSGTVNLLLDSSYQAIGVFGQTLNGGVYAVRATDGRTTMTYTSGVTTRSFVLYLDGPANGYVVELNSSSGNAGLLEAQSAGPFDTDLVGLFVGGTQYPEDSYPIVLLPAVQFAGNSFTANYANGFYSLDTNSGRGVGTLNTSGNPVTAMALYIVRPDKVLTLQMATPYSNAAISWLSTD